MSLWYERAIIYQLPPALFLDANGDGIGDFMGATRALDYLANLGVNCLWLQPFYDSPRRDAGYDIADYFRVDPRFGSGGDFVRFVEEAEARGLRVIIDLCFQHTSDQHAWFREARADRHSPYRDYYIWADEPHDLPGDENLLGGDGVWTFDQEAGQYYHHTFYPFQPDLNLGHPALLEEFQRILHFWLQLGVSGFRLDAVPHMVKPKHQDADTARLFDQLRDLRVFVGEKRLDAILVGEIDVEPPRYREYFGGRGERLRVILNFYLPGHAFLAFARGEAGPLRRVIEDLPTPPPDACYANFLRNHDELDLERLTPDEQREVRDAFGPEDDMRLFGRGLRRRLAPALGDDPRRIRLANSLLFSFPGVPVLYYGDEIGMGEDLSLHERDAVRTPMQWAPNARNGGFSEADPGRLLLPVVTGGPYGFEERNAADQRRDPASLLNWFRRLTRARRDCPEFGLAERPELLDVNDERVLAHLCRDDGGTAMALHNLSDRQVEVTLPDIERRAELIEVFADRSYEPLGEGPARLGPYGYRWFRCSAFYAR